MNLALALSALVLARHAKPPPPPAAAVIDVSSYAIDLAVDTSAATFTTHTLVKFTSQNSASELLLDSSGLEITSATLGEGGASVETSLAKQSSGDDVLSLKLPAPLSPGVETTVVINAKGKAEEGGDMGLIKRANPEDPTQVTYYTMFEPTGARRVFPCHDVPDDKATFQWTVTADADTQVLSNGTSTSDEPVAGDGPKKHKVTWKLDKPQSTYLATVVLGKFEHLTKPGSLAIGLYATAGHKDTAQTALNATAKAAAFFADFLNTPFPWDHYDAVAIPGFLDSGMENTTLALLRATAVLGPTPDAHVGTNERVGVVIHELAHQWMGDDVTFKSWGDIWLSESFASYLGHQAEAEFLGNDSAWIRTFLATRNGYFRQEEGPRSHAVVQSLTNPLDAFDSTAYLKGSAVLRMLEDHLGREPMRKGLKGYLDAHAYGNATTDDFIADLQKATGKDLKAFAQAWLHEPGYPIIKVGSTWIASSNTAALSISQHASRGSRLFPGTLVIVAHRRADPAYDREIPVPMGSKGDTIGVELPAQPEWFNWNRGSAFLARFEHSIPVAQLQAEAMKDTDPTARLWAQLELAGSLANPESKTGPAGGAIPILADALKTDHSPYVRIGLMKELARAGSKSLPSPLDDAVFTEANTPAGLPADPVGVAEVKAAALALLGHTSLPLADKLLQRQIKDPDLAYDLLQGTAEGMATHASSAAMEAALKTHGERGASYRRAVLAGLARGGNDDSGPVLLAQAKALHTNSEDVRTILGGVESNTALSRSAAGASLLEGIAGDSSFNEELRAEAIRLLDPAHSPSARTALGHLAKSTNTHLAQLANQGLRGH